MPFSPPHLFETVVGIVQPTPMRPTLLLGAGMSYSLVPLPAQLMATLQPIQQEIETGLGVPHCRPIDITDPQSLYIWSGALFDALRLSGLNELDAKKAIATALRVTTDPCWSAKAKVPLRGTSARHRVIARLTREKRWYSIWSLNWDVWLERALHSVGIESHQSRKTASPALPIGWVRW